MSKAEGDPLRAEDVLALVQRREAAQIAATRSATCPVQQPFVMPEDRATIRFLLARLNLRDSPVVG